MASKTTATTYPIPLSCFITLKIGSLKLGSFNLSTNNDPKAVQSLVINKLDADSESWTQDKAKEAAKGANSANSTKRVKNNVIKNDKLGTVSSDFSTTPKGVLFSDATVTLTMANDLQLEKKLLNYIQKHIAKDSLKSGLVTLRYGYVNGYKSFSYRAHITGLEMSSDFYTLVLKLSWTNGTSDKYSKWNKKTKKAINKFFKKNKNKVKNTISSTKKSKVKKVRISDLVEIIRKNQKWKKGTITKTKKIVTESVPKLDTKKTPLEYLDQLRKKAVAANGSGKYRSRFRFDSQGDIVYEFVPTSFKATASYRAKKNYNFVMNMLPDGVVLDFKPVLVDGLAAASWFKAANSDKKEKKQRKKDFKNVFSVITNNSKETTPITYTLTNSKKNAAGLVNATDNISALNASATRINSAMGDLSNFTEAAIKNNFGKYAYSVALNASATMTILGDPQLQQGDLINVLPMYPAQSNSSGSIMHPSGGTYRIISIQDSISGGYYTTSLTLSKENNTKNLKKISTKKKKTKKNTISKDAGIIKVGDIVQFKGGKYYNSASKKDKKGYNASAGPAKVTKISKLVGVKGAHPYKLVHTTDQSTVLGWVDEGTFTKK